MRYAIKLLLRKIGAYTLFLGYLAVMAVALWLLGHSLKPF